MEDNVAVATQYGWLLFCLLINLAMTDDKNEWKKD